MKFFDRLLTIVITATLTSMVWIVFGSTLIDAAEDEEPVTGETETITPSAPPISAPSPETTASPPTVVTEPAPVPEPTETRTDPESAGAAQPRA